MPYLKTKQTKEKRRARVKKTKTAYDRRRRATKKK